MQDMQEIQVQFLVREDSLEEGRLPIPVFLPGEFHGQRSLAGYSPWGHKDLDTTEQLSMQAHNYYLNSSILLCLSNSNLAFN